MATRTLLVPTGDGSAPQVLRYDDGALSTRGRTLAWILAAMLLLLGTGVLTASGLAPITGATPTIGTGTTADASAAEPAAALAVDTLAAAAADTPAANAPATTVDQPVDPAATPLTHVIAADWDGPTLHVDWSGQHYTTVEADFVGERVASPGDRVERTLTLVNDGPAAAVMTVNLVLSQTIPEDAANPHFGETIDLFWDVAGVTGRDTFATLLDQRTPTVAEVAVPQGGTARITLGFLMPTTVTDAQSATVDSTALHFQLQARLTGDTPTEPPLVPKLPDLAVTGAQLTGAVLLVLGLLLVGWLLLAVARRRRCDDCGARIARGEEWTVHHGAGGRRVRCAECQQSDVHAS